MSFRFMRLMVFFDLPVETSEDRRESARFRKYLVKNGFVMDQLSVYSKIVLNNTAADAVKEGVRKNKTKKGFIQMLTVTEKQYNSIEVLVGESNKEVIDTTDRLVVL